MGWLFCFLSYSNAQDKQLTPNLITNTWSGGLTGNYLPGGVSGGNQPAYNPTKNTIMFGYTQGRMTQHIYLNKVFENSGANIQIQGYKYSLDYINNGLSRGTANFDVSLIGKDGSLIHKDVYALVQTSNWVTSSGIKIYQNPYQLSNLSRYTIELSGKDDRYWAGYYGPQVRNVNFAVQYLPDQCAINPLSSAECSGYAEAYKTQQCTANPLYDSSCPNYATALKAQQCAANALFDTTCPGYAEALFNQQCTLNPMSNVLCPGYAQAHFNFMCSDNPLYNKECPGYTQAFFNQNCTANALYSKECPGYDKAFFNLQCTVSALYNIDCPGYQQALLTQQCTISALYSEQCPGYSAALLNQKCSANPLYSKECPGYAQAYFNEQCSLNSLYDTKCNGYAKAFFDQQCKANPLFDNQCIGYQTAYFNQQCTMNPLYNIGCPGYQTAYFNQQCAVNALYNIGCPGYQQAYLNQRCLADPLYDKSCTNYTEAYKAKLLNESCQANPQSNPQCPGFKTIASSTTSISNNDSIQSIAEVAIIADPIVNQNLSAGSSLTSPTNPVNPVNNNINNQQQLGTGLTVPGLSILPTRPKSTTGSSVREQSRREALSVSSRAENQVKDNQTQQQQSIISNIGTVPGFDAYQSARIPDAVFYQTRDIYRSVTLPDNRRAQRALSERSDRIHQEMVNSQYNLTK